MYAANTKGIATPFCTDNDGQKEDALEREGEEDDHLALDPLAVRFPVCFFFLLLLRLLRDTRF